MFWSFVVLEQNISKTLIKIAELENVAFVSWIKDSHCYSKSC